MKFSDIPQFIRPANYAVNVPWTYIESWISENLEIKTKVELNPDFQREHVWTKKQQERYIEFILRGGQGSRDIHWNCNGWMKNWEGPIYLVDGKQRLQAVRLFIENKLKVYGYCLKEFESKLSFQDHQFKFHVNNLKTKAEVIQWYLDLNFGGTPHTEEERKRVISILEREKN